MLGGSDVWRLKYWRCANAHLIGMFVLFEALVTYLYVCVFACAILSIVLICVSIHTHGLRVRRKELMVLTLSVQ